MVIDPGLDQASQYVQKKLYELEIAKDGYKAATMEGYKKFANVFWVIIQEIENELGLKESYGNGDSKTDPGKPLDTGNRTNAGWSWSESGA